MALVLGRKGGVLIKIQELGVNLRIVDIANLEHVFYQGSCLYGIVGAHLLESGEIAGGEI